MVPVVDKNQKPLMPCSEKRARKMVKSGKATPFWKRGIFLVRLNQKPSSRKKQKIAVGIDPGTKREGFTVKSKAHTLLNIQATSVTWVKGAIELRRNMRRGRRFRHTPCRANRMNRRRGGISPSTKARWQWKLRICRWLEVGKRWFYAELAKLGCVETKQGYETKDLRDQHHLKKLSNKLAEKFAAHCVDSWVLANWYVGGHLKPDNARLLLIVPLRFHRRQLHKLQPEIGGRRKPYGGTRSLGFKRGSLVCHAKYKLTYIGGSSNGRISLHSLATSKRLTQGAKSVDCKFLTYNSWRTRFIPRHKSKGFHRV